MTRCPDVCDVVIDRLLELGSELDTDDEDHDDILAALAQVEFVRTPGSPEGRGEGGRMKGGESDAFETMTRAL